MMLTLGWFVFELKTTPFQDKDRTTSERWAANQRIGQRPAYQHLGPGEDVITLTGVLLPEITGGARDLDQLRAMMKSGKAWIMVDGMGYNLGAWFIESIREGQSVFFRDGAARKIEFSLTLKRTDEERADQLGDLALDTLDKKA